MIARGASIAPARFGWKACPSQAEWNRGEGEHPKTERREHRKWGKAAERAGAEERLPKTKYNSNVSFLPLSPHTHVPKAGVKVAPVLGGSVPGKGTATQG
jgi:hypothetical protein